MKKSLAEIIMDLASGKEVVIDTTGKGDVILEIFMQDGKIMANELKRPGTEDPYDQHEVRDITALTYMNWLIE